MGDLGIDGSQRVAVSRVPDWRRAVAEEEAGERV